MAVGPYVTGPCRVEINFRDGDGFEILGYSQDGIETQINYLYNDVHSDRFGGTQGAPLDRQLMGATARIPVQLTEFDPAVYEKMFKFIASNGAGAAGSLAAGELPVAGCLVGAEKLSMQVLIIGEKDEIALAANANADVISPINFLNCFFDGSQRIPVASKNSQPAFDLMALPSVADGTSGDGKIRLFVHRNTTAFADLKNIDLTP